MITKKIQSSKSLLKYILFFITLTTLSILYIGIDYLNRLSFDLFHENNTVKTFAEAQNIFNNYRVVTQENLPLSIRNSLKIKGGYFEIPIRDLQKKIVLDTRVYQLLTSSQKYNELWVFARGNAYLCVDNLLIKKMFELLTTLKNKGYNAGEIKITSCHRSLKDNEKAKGAISSMHLFGKAFDISVGDIDGDGFSSIKDKDIVYKLLDRKIIKNGGGVGYYSFSKSALHFDVRGKRARWDAYKRSQ